MLLLLDLGPHLRDGRLFQSLLLAELSRGVVDRWEVGEFRLGDVGNSNLDRVVRRLEGSQKLRVLVLVVLTLLIRRKLLLVDLLLQKLGLGLVIRAGNLFGQRGVVFLGGENRDKWHQLGGGSEVLNLGLLGRDVDVHSLVHHSGVVGFHELLLRRKRNLYGLLLLLLEFSLELRVLRRLRSSDKDVLDFLPSKLDRLLNLLEQSGLLHRFGCREEPLPDQQAELGQLLDDGGANSLSVEGQAGDERSGRLDDGVEVLSEVGLVHALIERPGRACYGGGDDLDVDELGVPRRELDGELGVVDDVPAELDGLVDRRLDNQLGRLVERLKVLRQIGRVNIVVERVARGDKLGLQNVVVEELDLTADRRKASVEGLEAGCDMAVGTYCATRCPPV